MPALLSHTHTMFLQTERLRKSIGLVDEKANTRSRHRYQRQNRTSEHTDISVLYAHMYFINYGIVLVYSITLPPSPSRRED